MTKREAPEECFRRQMKEARIELGLSQEQLALRLRDMGLDFNQADVSRIERTSGKKVRQTVSLNEAFAIAAALDVAPLSLFFPRKKGARLRIAPKVQPDFGDFWIWWTGAVSLRGETRTIFAGFVNEDYAEMMQGPPAPDPMQERLESDTRKLQATQMVESNSTLAYEIVQAWADLGMGEISPNTSPQEREASQQKRKKGEH